MSPGVAPQGDDATAGDDQGGSGPVDGGNAADASFQGCSAGVMCSDGCVDINSDPESCGACSRMCSPGEVCSNGVCQGACGAGLTACVGACVDLSASNNHCGQCGATCGAGFRCIGGSCACSGTVCHGKCTNIDEDPENCGGCGYGCPTGVPPAPVTGDEVIEEPPLARYCNMGLCSLYCSTGTNLCGLSCVRTESDDNNCGHCGVICPVGDHAVKTVRARVPIPVRPCAMASAWIRRRVRLIAVGVTCRVRLGRLAFRARAPFNARLAKSHAEMRVSTD